MTRAALLPMGSDPFLNAYWLRSYAQVWADEVDRLYVLMCGQEDPEVIDYVHDLVRKAPHAIIALEPQRLDHGTAIARLVNDCDATHVMLCEDDAFICAKGTIDAQFRRIESGDTDIVGCPRGSTTIKIIDAAAKKWGPSRDGHSLWPCFLFISRSDLLRTDGCYSARNWNAGNIVEGLGYTVDEPSSGDTFVSASYQLRDLGLRICLEPQYRIGEAEIGRLDRVPWFHVGSLSSGYGSHFLAGQTEDNWRIRVGAITLSLEPDWYKRCSFWRRVWQRWDGGLPAQHAAYGDALGRLMDCLGMDRAKLIRWDEGFQRIITWHEGP